MAVANVKIGTEKKGGDIHLCPGQNLFTGEKKFIEQFGEVNSLEEDLINLAAGIYGTDLSVKRLEREHYIRTIKVTVDVVNYHAFQFIKDDLEHALYVVSRDNWSISFVQKKGGKATSFEWTEKEGAVLLFSGGIDSMSAAAEFVKEGKELVLVSHNSLGNHVVDKCQKNVHSLIQTHFKAAIRHIQVRVFGRNVENYEFPKDADRENTQRTRSFLFLSIAALITRRCGFNKVLYMAENGQFAIHLPLNQARVGPFSTHTADPEFVVLMQKIFRDLLQNPAFEIQNPFLYKTKAEVFGLMPKQLQQQANESASCWMISRTRDNLHCGYCVPCISRRIAVEFNGISFNEYETDIFRANFNEYDDLSDQKRNIIDYLEFVSKFKDVTASNKNDLLLEFPELYNTAVNLDDALDLYKRVSQQSFAVLSSYKNVMALVK